jgi:exodeoxyribonuclease V alpha subunit
MISSATSSAITQDNYGEALARKISWDILKHYQKTSNLSIKEHTLNQLQLICSHTITVALNGKSKLSVDELGATLNISLEELKQYLSKPIFTQIKEGNDKDDVENSPFIIYQDKIYLRRYWEAEQTIIKKLKEIDSYHATHNGFLHTRNLQQILAPIENSFSTHQKQILHYLSNPKSGITIVSGGAGTGKSWASMRIFKTLLKTQPDSLYAVCAFTGKSVSRLSEELEGEENITVTTIHQLLRLRPQSNQPQYHNNNLLAYEFLLIDEVSMIDMELLAKLLIAVRKDCKVLLIGDPGQLFPVGVGGGLELIQQTFVDKHICLQTQHRFQEDSEIHHIAKLAREGQFFDNELPSPHNLKASIEQQNELLEQWIEDYLFPCYHQKEYQKIVQQIVLSPWRYSADGMLKLNQFIQKKLHEKKLISQAQGWCEGLVIVMRKNDYVQKIYNGDKAYLQMFDGCLYAIFVEQKNRKIPLETLENFELALALTFHKIQGSEADNVFLWLGTIDTKAKQWIDNNLLYTSITRAKKTIQICGDIV